MHLAVSPCTYSVEQSVHASCGPTSDLRYLQVLCKEIPSTTYSDLRLHLTVCEETLDLKDSQAYTDQFITGLHSSLVRDLGKRGWQRKRREVRKNILRNPILLSISLICFFLCVFLISPGTILYTHIYTAIPRLLSKI